jgi:hypothetical protein
LHLERHETFQRKKQGGRYREAWIVLHADLRAQEESLRLAIYLEHLLAKAAKRVGGLTDGEVYRAVSELLPYLSPIELVRQPLSLLGRLLWQELAPQLEAGKLSREQVKEGLSRQIKLIEALRNPESPRAFLQGLLEHMDTVSEPDTKQRPNERRLIVTPEELRDATE